MKVLRETESICPECVEDKRFNKMKIKATVFERDGKVWIKKRCSKHGKFEDLYWGDYEMYKRASRFKDPGIKLQNPNITIPTEGVNCPLNCGLCTNHKSHTGLGNIVLTNRCDLSCWYCFFFAKEGEPIYEPTIDQIRDMVRNLRNEKPIGCNAIQLTGGEPSVRDDVIDIVKMIKDEGYDHIQFNTDGIRLSRDLQFIKDIRKAGVNVLYLSFDGLTPESNPKNYWEVPKAVENCRKAGLGVVLVPTIIKGINDDQVGDIVRFASANMDIIRGVDFQPVSLVGRMPKKEREKMRITIPDVTRKIGEQTDGEITSDDFWPVPTVSQITDFIETLQGRSKYRLSTHFACGAATYAFKDDETGKLIPLSRFVDVYGLLDYVEKLTKDMKKGKSKTLVKIKLLLNLSKFMDKKKRPKGLKLSRAILGALRGGSYGALRDFHHKSLFIGMMHFMDPYNYDIQRVERCCIHYAVPDGRIIPFCAFNVIPELYRDTIQKKFSISHKEWEKRTNKKLSDDKYVRKISKGEEAKIRAYYDQFRQ